MFDRLPYKWRKKKIVVLEPEEQNRLMTEISRASGINEVDGQFNRLYESVVYPMWDLFYRKYVPPLNSDELKDIFQEAWVKVLESREKYNPAYNAFNWIYVIKKNIVIDRLRKNKRRTEIDIHDDKINQEIMNLVEGSQAIDDKIIEKESTKILKVSINEINDETVREVMERRIVKGQKLELISKEMNIPLSSLHLMIKKCLKSLRPKIESLINS